MACQTRSLLAGMSNVRTPSGSRACITALMTTGRAPTVPASPGTLGSERIELGRHRIAVDHHVGQGVGARHGVLHEGDGEELARFRLVDHLLHEGLPHALGDPAVDLSLE